MNHKTNLFAMVSAVIVLGTTNINAEATRTQPTCKTEPQCTKLSDALRVQIGVLEAKGIENLTEKEFNKLDTLQDELSVVQDSIIVLAKAKTAELKAKTAEMRKAQDKKMEEIMGLLSKKISN